MTHYISILRGINVGGKRRILMSDLMSLYQRLDFSNVTTFIQSGNVIFDLKRPQDANNIAAQIERSILEAFGFNVPVIVRTSEEMRKIIASNPFLKEPNIDINTLHLTFLSSVPSKTYIEELEKTNFLPDRYVISGKDIYSNCSGRYSDSKLTNSFFEKKLKVTATTRNWKTVGQIYKIADDRNLVSSKKRTGKS